MRVKANILPIINPENISLFWDNVNIGNDKDCWKWKAAKDALGYGIFSLPIPIKKYGRSMYPYKTHRISYYLKHAIDPKQFVVCHSCDNPACVNPNHLFLGDDKKNKDDSIEKGRASFSFGMWQTAKVTKETIIEVLRLTSSGLSQKKVASLVGVNQSTVCRILNKKRYSYIINKL